eukprot:g10262.t1
MTTTTINGAPSIIRLQETSDKLQKKELNDERLKVLKALRKRKEDRVARDLRIAKEGKATAKRARVAAGKEAKSSDPNTFTAEREAKSDLVCFRC